MSELFSFQLKGNNGIYTCSFDLTNGTMKTSCTCKAGQDGDLCWHRSYILSGQNERFVINDFETQRQQKELIERASEISGGKNMIAYANGRYKREKMKGRKRNFPVWAIVVLSLVGLFVFIGVIAVISGPDESKTASASSSPAIKVTALKYYNDYEQNEVSADDKYKGKKIEITGTVAEISKDETDGFYIELAAGEISWNVRCYVIKAIANLSKKGQEIKLEGTGDGMEMAFPVIKNCVLK